ncbi:translation initiation factor IF-3 [Candidatus Wolfebacteria bacterium GWA1_42_9]|uniref:Translation initiation factor IF-3 n=2 Tax=Candidatus Wolfeibacteriota TaxID=1752735 RepID=A0A1F8DL16_9BACT|nr:MAG: translation initiation factor IF-3 [Candidatus Wolfebacteria bacterium GWA1_42_9]
MVDSAGKNLGVMTKEEALKLAQEQGLDVIEIAPTANPPVAKIISFDKFRYQQKKEEKKQRAHQSKEELKQVRITPRSAKNDLKIKAKKVEEFLLEGHKVEIMIFLRGREKYNREWATGRLEEFLKMIEAEYKVTMPQRSGGKGIVMQIARK